MRNFLTLIASSYCVSMLALGTACTGDGAEGPSASITLRFAAQVDGQPLRLGAHRYTSPTGSGEFAIEDFKLYVSNVVLRNSENGQASAEPSRATPAVGQPVDPIKSVDRVTRAINKAVTNLDRKDLALSRATVEVTVAVDVAGQPGGTAVIRLEVEPR